ncbi:MAG: PQQ-binding-like beta-propeller repeat protein [Planctomycetota bacterium]
MKLSHRSIRPITLMICLLMTAASFADWTQWRGPDRLGTVADADWPAALNDTTLKKLWRVELAEGYPGPIVSGGRVFTFESLDAKNEVVRAFDVSNGKQVWEASWAGAMRVPFFAKRNGDWVKSTPATDGEYVYAIGMQDELACLKAADGGVVWKVDFKERYETQGPSFGQPCSPLLDGDALYIQAGMSVCRLDKKTGETVWRAMVDQRQMMGGAFSSPVIATVAGKRQLLVQTRGELCGLDLDTGDVLWRKQIKAFRGMNILPPTAVDENHVFTSSYGGGSFMFKITADDDGGFNIELVWSDEKSEGYMSSPQVIDGHLYMHGRHQTWWCIEAKTGEVKWSVKDKKYGEYSTMVVSGNRILSLGFDGTLRMINATPEKFDVVSEWKVTDQETWGHLAVVGDVLYIRELKGLVAYRLTNAGVN